VLDLPLFVYLSLHLSLLRLFSLQLAAIIFHPLYVNFLRDSCLGRSIRGSACVIVSWYVIVSYIRYNTTVSHKYMFPTCVPLVSVVVAHAVSVLSLSFLVCLILLCVCVLFCASFVGWLLGLLPLRWRWEVASPRPVCVCGFKRLCEDL